ncbi:ionotropic receptor 21a [Colletes gigas]|uniref:ionotropic receptor 21a n=1 Tax=Colletes gigas TaxID=935657 RepID=UPI001C9B7887|nr:ionotropic receptor 21a [Colletes gigas]
MAGLLLYALVLSAASSLDAKNDILDSATESWITDDDFAKIVRFSLPFSRCCNVLFDGSMGDTEVLFRQFRSVYPYEYLLKQSTYDCNGYLLLGSSDEEIRKSLDKIPSLLWNTEILILVNNNVSNNSSLLDYSSYGIANVIIVSVSGIWRLSENYLKPRIFNKHDRYDGLKHEYDNFNFRGREMQVCSVHRPPFTFFNRTINKVINGVQANVFVHDTDLQRDGIEMQLFLIMAEKLNFTWTIRKPEGNTPYGERFNATAWDGGMIGMIHEKKVDMAFGGIWIIHDQNEFVHLSEPWYQLVVNFLVPRPRPRTSFWALTRPFSGKVWSLLASLLLLQSLYMYGRAQIDSKFPKRFRNFLVSLIDLIGTFLSSSVPPTTTNNKLGILLWQTAGWLIISVYCSSLAARLATLEYENRIDTTEQFLAANLTWGRINQPPPFRDYFDLTDDYAVQLPKRFRNLKNAEELNKLITDGNFAILGKIVDNCFFPDDSIPNDKLKNFRLMRQSVGRFYAAVAIQPWLLMPVNRMVLLLKQTGIANWHMRNVIRRRSSYNLRDVFVEHDGYDGSVQVLGLRPLAAGFSLLVVGSSIAALVFYLELKRAAGSTSIYRVLRSIAGKRIERGLKNRP